MRTQAIVGCGGAVTIVIYRMLSAAVFRDAQVTLLAVRATVDDLPFVVPLEAWSRYVGIDMPEQQLEPRLVGWVDERSRGKSHHGDKAMTSRY